MKWMSLIVCILIAGCGVEGLHNANPNTRLSADPWGGFQFYNSKDVAVNLEEGSYDPKTGAVALKNLNVTDNASEVRRANVEQIDAITRQQEAIYAGWQALHEQTMSMVKALAAEVVNLGGVAKELLQGSNLQIESDYVSGSAALGTATTRPQ